MNKNNCDHGKSEENSAFRDPEDISEIKFTKKINLLSSEQITHFINKLSSPSFLGSIHMKDQSSQNSRFINKIINENLENKLAKSLKSPLVNPITRWLFLSMILFNVLWILFIYLP